MTDNRQQDILLCGDSRFDKNKNKIILEATISYWKILKEFLDPLLNNNLVNCSPINTYTPETIKPLLVSKIFILYCCYFFMFIIVIIIYIYHF